MDLNNYIKGVYINNDDFTFDETNKYVRVTVASETKKGLVKFATAAERDAGESDVAVTPADVNQIIADANITVEDASATAAGIVNLEGGQVLGSGAKIIDGVTVSGQYFVSVLKQTGTDTSGDNVDTFLGTNLFENVGGNNSIFVGHNMSGVASIAIGSTTGSVANGAGMQGFGNTIYIGRNGQADLSSATRPAQDSIVIGDRVDLDEVNNAVVIGHDITKAAIDSVVIGMAAKVDLSGGTAVGDGASVGGYDGVAIGRSSNAKNNGSVVIGAGASVKTNSSGIINNFSVAVGLGATVGGDGTTYGDGSVAVGGEAVAGSSADALTGGCGSTAIGSGARAGSSLLGDGLKAGKSTALGHGATAEGFNTTAIGAGSVTTKDNQIVLGNTDVTTVETHGRYAAKGFVGNFLSWPNLPIDLNQGEYFIKVPGDLASEPINFPEYAFNSGTLPSIFGGSVVSIVVEVLDDGGIGGSTGFWSGIRWQGGVPPTLTNQPGKSDLFGFIGTKYQGGSTVTWTGIVLAQNVS